MSNLRSRPDAEEVNRLVTERVQQCGFTRSHYGHEYTYQGGDPATALGKLLKVRPLVLDCLTALVLLTHRSLLNELGNEQFNSYIKEVYGGVLSIDCLTSARVPSTITTYYSARHEQSENWLPAQLQHGDRLWIQGPADGYAFHPTCDTNAYNVLADMSRPNDPSLVGFVSDTSATGGAWSYDDLRNLLLKAYNAPLTLRDLAFLHARHQEGSQQLASYSAWSFHQAYKWLNETQPDAMAQALQQLNDTPVNLDHLTTLLPPEADAIRGVVRHVAILEPVSLHSLINGSDNANLITRSPYIPPGTPFRDLIHGFETHLPHQQQIHVAMEEFYRTCKDNTRPPFQATILYGNAGTGKTMASTAVLNRLADEEHTVWRTNVSESEDGALLNVEEWQQLLTLWQSEGFNAFFDALTAKFRPAWDQADILFIDGISNNQDILANVSIAALQYARTAGKKILIIGDNGAVNAVALHIHFPIDSISIRHIDGPDYRAENSGHR